jgi:hypothetical protein
METRTLFFPSLFLFLLIPRDQTAYWLAAVSCSAAIGPVRTRAQGNMSALLERRARSCIRRIAARRGKEIIGLG